MTRRTTTTTAFFLTLLATTSQAFSPAATTTLHVRTAALAASIAEPLSETPTPEPLPSPPQKTPKKKKNNTHKDGLFSPVVYGLKTVMGDEQLNQLRAKVISMHSDIIASFCNTANSVWGQSVVQLLFQTADIDDNGVVDATELQQAFSALGFDWIQQKQAQGIIQRADVDDNGVLDWEEYRTMLPKTLRTNLTKLAKKNGQAMGLLV